jgi:Coenzyme PQQ synthesis protein D (PqqD)
MAEKTLMLRADDVVWRVVGEELVVLELATSTYLTLNGTARQLWEGLTEGATAEDLVEMLVDRYGIPKEHAVEDVQSFLAALTDRGLLVANE